MPIDKGQVGKFCELSVTPSEMGCGCSWEKSRETKGVGRGAEFLSFPAPFPVQAQQHLDVPSVMLLWGFPGSCCEQQEPLSSGNIPGVLGECAAVLPLLGRCLCWLSWGTQKPRAPSGSLPLKWCIPLFRRRCSSLVCGYWLDGGFSLVFVITLSHFSHSLLNALAHFCTMGVPVLVFLLNWDELCRTELLFVIKYASKI